METIYKEKQPMSSSPTEISELEKVLEKLANGEIGGEEAKNRIAQLIRMNEKSKDVE